MHDPLAARPSTDIPNLITRFHLLKTWLKDENIKSKLIVTIGPEKALPLASGLL